MSRVKSLRAKQAELLAKQKELLASLDKAESADEKSTIREQVKAVKAEFDAVSDDLQAAIAVEEAEKAMAAAAPAASDEGARIVEEGKKAAGIISVTDNAEADPKRGFRDHKDFLKAVMNAGLGGRVDARLRPLAAAGSDEHGVYSDPHGGFLVPHGIAPGILAVEPEDDPIFPLLTQVPMTAPTVSFNARVDKDHSTSVSGGFVVTRRPETVEGTPSRARFEQVVLTANEEFGLSFASERILTDSPQSFIAIIQAGFRDEFAAHGMNERINGIGSGEPLGLMNAGCKIVVSKESGQKAATILKENIDKMAARCWRYSRAVWLANHNTRPQLKSIVQAVGTGGSVVPYFVTEGAPAGFDGLLDGRPLKFTEFAKSLGSEGDLILFVPSEYLWGTYQSEQFAESIHVRFTSAERAFRFYRRNDGRPWWTEPLTPRNGDTLSPIVTLQAR